MTMLSATATEVEIKGATYAVEAIAPGEFGVSAVRVVKLASGESYDVIRTNLNVVEPAPPAVEPAANPRDDWPAWTDEDRWTITPEPASEIDLTSFAPVTIEAIEPDGRTVSATLEANGDLVFRRAAPAPAEAVSRTRATFLPSFSPTPEDDAERLGFTLGREGESANPPPGWAFPTLVRFFEGYLAGKADLEAEVLEDLAWIEERNRDAFSDPMDRIHPAELAEWGR